MSKEYNPGKIKPIIKIIAEILQADPALHNDHARLMEIVYDTIPELQDKTRCANCEASMSQYIYNLNVIDTALIIGMARYVQEATSKGIDFTEANRIYVPTLPISLAAKCRTTRCAKLGLIAKYKQDGRHLSGTWSITRRGFAALRGEEIPDGIIVWRKQTIERPEKMITFEQIRAGYQEKVDKYINKHNEQPNDSYGKEVMKYNSNEWINFGGIHEGSLF